MTHVHLIYFLNILPGKLASSCSRRLHTKAGHWTSSRDKSVAAQRAQDLGFTGTRRQFHAGSEASRSIFREKQRGIPQVTRCGRPATMRVRQRACPAARTHVGDAAEGPRVVAGVHLGAEARALAEAAGRRAVGLRRRALAAGALSRLRGCGCCDAGHDCQYRSAHRGQHGGGPFAAPGACSADRPPCQRASAWGEGECSHRS